MTPEQARSDRRPLLLGIVLILVLAAGGYLFYRQSATASRLTAQIKQLRADVIRAEKAATSAKAAAAKAEDEAKRARSAVAAAISARDRAVKAFERAESFAKSANVAASKLRTELAAAKAQITRLKTRITTREVTQARVERLVATFHPQLEQLTKSDITVDGIRGHDAVGNVLENGLVLLNLSIRPKDGAKDGAPIRIKRITVRRYDFAQPDQPRFLEIEATGVTIPIARLNGPVKRALEKAGISTLVGKIRYDAYYDESTKVAAIRLLEIDIDGFGRLSLSLSYATGGGSRANPTGLLRFARFDPAHTSLRSLTLQVVNREGYQVLLKGIATLEGTSEGLLVRKLTGAIVAGRAAAEQQKFTLLVDLYDAALTFMKQRGGVRIIVAPTKPVNLAELIKIAGKDPAALKTRLNVMIETLPRPY